MSAARERIAIIGGGISGLASAALLANDGHEVTLYERARTVGGRAGRWESAGFRFDTGPSWYLMPEVFDHFYRLLGTSSAEQLDLVRLDPGYRVHFENDERMLDIQSDRERSIRLFESVEPGAGRALAAYLDSAESTYELAMRHFLYTDFSSPTALLPAVRGGRALTLARLLLEPLDRLIARQVSSPRLRQVLGYPAVFLGASPSSAPSMYHLMSRFDLADGVLYPMGGFTRLIDSITDLATAAGVEIRTGTSVDRIDVATDRRVTGLTLRTDAGFEQVRADRVVSTVDRHHSDTQLLEHRYREYPARHWRRAQPGPGAVLAMLGVRGRLPGLAHHTLVFAEDWTRNFDTVYGGSAQVPDPASFYVCAPSVTDPSVAPDGDENLFVLIPVPADAGIGLGGVDRAGSDAVETAVDRAIAELSRHTGAADLADRIVVRRTVGPADFERDLHSWRGSSLGPGHTLTQSAFFRGGIRSRRVRGLLYAGSTTIPGIGLPMCLISAELVLKAVRGDRTTAPLPEPVRSSVS